MKNIYHCLQKSTLVFWMLALLSLPAIAHFGPRSPLAGYVTCAISYNGLVYFGTENGGVFESTNTQLTTWRPRPVGMLTGQITALTHSGSYLFAGTADGGVYVFDGYVGNDRYWNKASTGLGNMQIKSLVAVDSITVLAGTDGGGLYRTTNKGASWTAVNDANLNNASVTSLARGGGRYFATTLTGGVFASDTDGNSWFSFNDVHTQGINGTATMRYNDTTDVLLVLNANGLFAAGTASSTMSPTYSAASSGLANGSSIRSLANNGTTWFAATSAGVYSSPNSGFAWTAANTGLTGTDVTAITALPANVVVAMRKVGIYKSPTTAIAWTFTNTGFNNPITHSMITSGDSLVVAVTSEGVFVSKKLGSPATTFVRSNHGLTDSTHVRDILLAQTALYAATSSGVFVSQDTGATWATANTGLTNLDIEKLFYGNNQVYALNHQGMLYTKSLGSGAWTMVMNGLPNGVEPTSMAFYGNRILLGTLGDGVYWMDQHGSSWTAFNTGLSNMDVTSVAASKGRFYAGTDGDGVFISTVDSAAWTATAQTSIPHTTMIGLDGDAIQAMNSYAGYVYCSYKGGVLATADDGQLWEEGGNQFNLPSFTNVHKISFVRTRVFALTDNNGPYSNSLAELPTLPNFLTVSDQHVHVPSSGRTDFVTVNSNVVWTLVSSQPWITVTPVNGSRDGTLEITTAANAGAMRMGTVTITSDSIPSPLVIDVMQDGLVGIGQAVADAGNVYVIPNPNSGRFTLDFAQLNTAVKAAAVLDLNGRTVREWSLGPGSKQVAVELTVAPGTYFVRLETATGLLYKQLLVH